MQCPRAGRQGRARGEAAIPTSSTRTPSAERTAAPSSRTPETPVPRKPSDLCSRRLKVSRSRLLADAARQYLAQQRAPLEATAAWNDVIAKAGQPGDDPAALAQRRRSKRTLRVAAAKRR
jgi:hypothetical protein